MFLGRHALLHNSFCWMSCAPKDNLYDTPFFSLELSCCLVTEYRNIHEQQLDFDTCVCFPWVGSSSHCLWAAWGNSFPQGKAASKSTSHLAYENLESNLFIVLFKPKQTGNVRQHQKGHLMFVEVLFMPCAGKEL